MGITDREKAIKNLEEAKKSKSLGRSTEKEMLDSMNSMRKEPQAKAKRKSKSLGKSTQKEMTDSMNSMRSNNDDINDDNYDMYAGE